MNKGVLITLEGPDACGKTTQCNYLEKLLTDKGYKVTRSREPGGTEVAEKLRAILLQESLTPMTEMFLFFACRAENIEKIIKPAINRGEVVIFDRFIDSSVAFQGYGRGLMDQVYELKSMLFERTKVRIDHTLFFDITQEESLRRLKKRSGEDRFELENMEFKDRVFKGYQEVLDDVGHRISKIDANGTIEEVKRQIFDWVEKFTEQYPLL